LNLLAAYFYWRRQYRMDGAVHFYRCVGGYLCCFMLHTNCLFGWPSIDPAGKVGQ
jgi:hypothetical protein